MIKIAGAERFSQTVGMIKLVECTKVECFYLNDGGTLSPFGIEMLPKSTKNATHHTDNQSEIHTK